MPSPIDCASFQQEAALFVSLQPGRISQELREVSRLGSFGQIDLQCDRREPIRILPDHFQKLWPAGIVVQTR